MQHSTVTTLQVCEGCGYVYVTGSLVRVLHLNMAEMNASAAQHVQGTTEIYMKHAPGQYNGPYDNTSPTSLLTAKFFDSQLVYH